MDTRRATKFASHHLQHLTLCAVFSHTVTIFCPINSQIIGAFVRVAGRHQLGTRPAWLMLMSVTYPTDLAPPTLLLPATTLRVPSTVDPVLLVTLNT